MKSIRPFIGAFALVSSLSAGAIIVSCSTGDSSSSDSTTSYNGLGSKWSASFDESAKTFTVTYDTSSTTEPDGTIDMTISGTYEEFSNRIRKLTVTAAEGENAPPVGDVAFGIEIPGFAFFLRPQSADQEPIVMVQAGECPTTDLNANWTKASFESAPGDSSPAFGSGAFAIYGSDVTATISQRKFGDASAVSGSLAPTGTCSAGEVSMSGGATMYITASGGALVKGGRDVIFLAPEFSGATTADLEGTYTAIVFSGNKTAGDGRVFNGKMTFAADGTGTGLSLDDAQIADDVTTSDPGPTFNLAPVAGTNGLFHGTVNGAPLNCMLSKVDTETVLSCNGAGDAIDSGSSTYLKTFFVLGVKR